MLPAPTTAYRTGGLSDCIRFALASREPSAFRGDAARTLLFSAPVMQKQSFTVLFSLFVFAACAAFSRSANAGATVAADLDYAHTIDPDVGSGWGFGVRLGEDFHVPALVATPEIGFTYDTFSDAPGPTAYRGIFGLRLRFGEVLRPGIFAHAGLGRLSLDQLPDASHTAFT